MMKNRVTLLLLTVLFSSLMFKPAGALRPQTNSTDFPPGTSIFVDGINSSDIEDGTLSHPFNTIQEGINPAVSGNRVGVAPGVYYERINIKAGVQLFGTDPATTIIDGGGSGPVVTLNTASVLKGFTVQNGRASDGAGVLSIGQPVITNNIIKNNVQSAGGAGAAVYGNNSSPIITYNLITENTGDNQWSSGAVSFHNSSSPYIAGNVIMNNTGRGAINITVPSGNRPTIVNNTILNNTGAGIKVDARVDQTAIHITNNISFGNTIGILIDFGSPAYLPVFAYNDVYGNTTNFVGMTDISGSNGNVSLDPQLSDTFHLSYSSPLIDSGSPNVYSPEDFDGSARPLDGNGDWQAVSDIGADERVYGDDIPPSISVTATTEDGAPYTANTWTNQTVTLKYICLHSESGSASCPVDQVFSEEGITQETDATASDLAGNSASVSFGSIKIDKTPPVFLIGVFPNPVLLNGNASLEKNAADQLSGIMPGSLACFSYNTATVDTTTVGTKSVTCFVYDYARNITTATAEYQVIYDFDGFYNPIVGCTNNACNGFALSQIRGGSTVPFKFQLRDANGAIVRAASAPLWLEPIRFNSPPAFWDPSRYVQNVTNLPYEWKKSQNLYTYEWSTKGLPIPTIWLAGVKLDDGTTHSVFIALIK